MINALIARKILSEQTLKDFKVGDGQCLNQKKNKLEVKKVGVFRRICCKIAPSLSLKREHQEAVKSIQQAIAFMEIGKDDKWAALVLQKAGVGKISVVEGRIIVNASALIGRSALDRILDTTRMTKKELIKDQKNKLDKKTKAILLSKRKRAPLPTAATPGLKKPAVIPSTQPPVESFVEISQRKIAKVTVPKKTPIQAKPAPTKTPAVGPKKQVFNQLIQIEPGLVSGDFQTLNENGIFDDINENAIKLWQPREFQQRADFCMSVLRREKPKSKSSKTASLPKTALQQLLEPVTDNKQAREQALFQKVKGSGCKTEADFQTQLSLFQMMQGFKPELDLQKDFPVLVKKGVYFGIDEELTQSWDYDQYQALAEESMVKVGRKKASPNPLTPSTKTNTPPTQPLFSQPAAKPVLSYAKWSASQRSYNPLAYALACSSHGSTMEPNTIAERLKPFVTEKLQKDYVMPLSEVETTTDRIFNNLGLKPGNEKQVVYRQVFNISREIRREGGAYLSAHPLPQKVEPPVKPIPDVAWTLPKELHNKEDMIAFGELHKAKLVTKDEYVELCHYLPSKTMVTPDFKLQMEAYKWLKGTGHFTRSHFVEAMREGIFSPDIARQLLKQKHSKADPNKLASKLIVKPLVTPDALTPPVSQPAQRAQASRARPVYRQQSVQQPEIAVVVKPAGQKLAGIQALRRHPGMENFSNTCYFNATCQQLSFAIPPETVTALRAKKMKNPEADSVRDAFCELMTMLTNPRPNRNNQIRQSNVQKQLLNACYNYGLSHPDADISKVVKSPNVERLTQEDASDFTRALSEVLQMKDHSECTLRETSQFALTVGGTKYTRIGNIQEGELTRQVPMPRNIDTKAVSVQDCMDASVATERLDGNNKKYWTMGELADAKCPHGRPGFYPSEKSFTYISDDLSKLKTHTMSLSVYSQDWDDSLGKIVSIKQPQWGRKIISKGADRVTMPIFDKKSQSLQQVPMELQSAVVHIGSTKDGGHYVMLARSAEGTWMLFNDSRSQTYSSLTEFLNEDKHRCPTQLSYAVVSQ